MSLSSLAEKVLPLLLVAATITSSSAYVELKVLAEKVSSLEEKISTYHKDK